MTRRLTVLGLAVLATSLGVAWGAAARTHTDARHPGALAGRWYTPSELRALIAHSNASYEEKGVLLAVRAGADALDLSDGGDLHESLGAGPPGERDLRRGVEYQASTFPRAVRLRAPDDRWSGVQVHSGAFGFVQLHHMRVGNVPLHGWGYLTIEASKRATPSAATVIRRLHETPKIVAGPVTTARVAGYTGFRFDATIVGTDRPKPRGISLAPFTTNRHCGYCTKTMNGETLDHKMAWTGERYRIIALDVRGTTVVLYLQSAVANQPDYPDAQVFATFLPFAQAMLATLRFPA